MNTRLIAAMFALFLILCLVGVIAYVYLFGQKETELDVLLRTNREAGMSDARAAREALKAETEEEEGEKFQLLREAQRTASKKGKVQGPTEEQRYYMAGIYTERERREFGRFRYIGAAVAGPILGGLIYFLIGDTMLALCALPIGAGFGYQSLPSIMLDRRIVARNEEIMYYLPLVIEQIAIGVSSSLDTGPALQTVVQMADERDSHNPCTELVGHVELMVRSGMSLSEALTEVGLNSGHNQVKHTFMALAQVTKHGGEISKQLMELGVTVTTARENMIDEQIRKLELKATGPVAMVFFGFIIILLIGFGMNIKNAL